MSKIYDVLIIGGGPAGLTAGLYAGRAKLSTIILEGEKAGGQIVTTDEVENYPGSVEDPSGPKLIKRMVDQFKGFGGEMVFERVESYDFDSKVKVVKTSKNEYKAKAVILATGAKPRKLGAEGEEKYTGKGVSFCATCDAAFFEDLEVFVIGGGDTAVEESIFISKFARKVTVIHRREELRAAKSIQEKAFANPKIDFIYNTAVEKIAGDGIVEEITIKNLKTGEEKVIKADEEDGTFGVFVMVGYIPQTDIFKGKVEMDERGYLLGDVNMKTNIEGVFVAGDCRQKPLRQVVTATADGAIATISAEKYIEENFEE